MRRKRRPGCLGCLSRLAVILLALIVVAIFPATVYAVLILLGVTWIVARTT